MILEVAREKISCGLCCILTIEHTYAIMVLIAKSVKILSQLILYIGEAS